MRSAAGKRNGQADYYTFQGAANDPAGEDFGWSAGDAFTWLRSAGGEPRGFGSLNYNGPFQSVNQARFSALWVRNQTADSKTNLDRVWVTVIRRYAEPQRHYHSIRHLQHCLRQFDLAYGRIEHADAVEMALWFHDIIYIPGAGDNEQQSARLFEEVAAGDLATELVAEVRQFILATQHRVLPENQEACYVVDIDLSSFGVGWQEYLEDNRALREELKEMPGEQYYPSKLDFLRGLLKRERIYCTDFFYDRYEQIARRNIGRYLTEFAAGRLP